MVKDTIDHKKEHWAVFYFDGNVISANISKSKTAPLRFE